MKSGLKAGWRGAGAGLSAGVVLCLLAASAAAKAVYVAPPPGGDDANDGLSPATPKATIAAAIAAAAGGDEIVIASGTYYVPAAINVNKEVTIRSASGAAHDVILDGSNRVSCLNVTAAATFQGLTVTHASNTTSMGGAMYVNQNVGTTVFRDCCFMHNYGTYGGAGRIDRPAFFDSCCIVSNGPGGGILANYGEFRDCLIASNRSIGSAGGGVAMQSGGAKSFVRCIISNNVAIRGDSGLSGSGGGVSYSGGTAPTFDDCDIVDNTCDYQGGGVYLTQNGSVLRNCRLLRNTAIGDQGGAGRLDASAILVDCTIADNQATNSTAGGFLVYGGAFTNCVFSGNRSKSGGGAVTLSGTAAKTFAQCIFSNNVTSASYGGAVNMPYGTSVTPWLFDRCHFLRNENRGGNAGALFAYMSDVIYRNCLFAGNQASGNGGALDIRAPCNFVNCTITGNKAASGGGVVFAGGTPTFTNTILHGNLGGSCSNYYVISGSPIYSHCCVTPAVAGAGNIDADPLFVAAGSGAGTNLLSGAFDFRLTRASPCKDAGLNLDWMAGATDIAGNSRVLNGVVDIGAYEYRSPLPAATMLLLR
jgi:hypothetical protein